MVPVKLFHIILTSVLYKQLSTCTLLLCTKILRTKFARIGSNVYLQLMAQFRIFPSSESRHSFVANYTSAVKFKIHNLVLFCCIIIPLYVSERKYL